jgi:OOP family OmpA-OmpF porin
MKKHKRVMIASFIGAAIALTSATAFAQARSDAGWYLGASFGQSEVDIEGCDLAGVTCDEKDTAWRILGGYRINRNFAIELGFHQFGDASASGPGGNLNFEANAFELVGLGAFPLGNEFSIYGKAGLYRGETKVTGSTFLTGPVDIKETNTDLTYGIGAQYDVNRQLGIRLEWQRYTNMGDNATIGESDVDVMSVGLVFRF